MRAFLAFLIGLGLVILVIIFLIRLIFGGGGGPEVPKTNLVDYARTNVVMRLTIDGPVVADQDHQRIQIDVGQTGNEARLITGYEGHVAQNKSVPNNATAYANFLRAIDLQGYTNGDDAERLQDERGVCPQGQRFIFEIIDGTETKQRFWSTSCDGAKSFRGNAAVISNLFRAQIPDYHTFTSQFGLR